MAVEIIVPRLGWSMEEGIFSGWLIPSGMEVRRGQGIFTLEGEKATQDIESVGDGILHYAPDSPEIGQVVSVGRLIGMLCVKGELPVWNQQGVSFQSPDLTSPINKPVLLQVSAPPSVRRLARQMGINWQSIKPAWPGGRIERHDLESTFSNHGTVPANSDTMVKLITPRARRLAKQHNIDWNVLAGSGRNGRIREKDLKQIIMESPISHAENIIPMSGMRKSIARHMTNSRHQTVPVTLTANADASMLIAARALWKQHHGDQAATLNDALLVLIGHALKMHPVMAAQWKETHLLMPFDDGYHIGLAVDAPHGLVVPVIRNVTGQSLSVVACQTRELIGKARANTLQQSDMNGGVFTVTSLASFGIRHFTPVINVPQCAILGLGAIYQEAFPDANGMPVFRPILPISLTFDHRIVDGAPAARFLQTVVKAIEGYSLA